MAKEPFHFVEAMIERYPSDQYARFFELADRTAGANARADALVMSLWPSRGLAIHGFELKENRSDWLREKKAPKKAEHIARFCDFWWLVTPAGTGDIAVAKEDEIPAAWGWLAGSGTKLRCLKQARQLKPRPITREFLASILREVQTRYTASSTVGLLVKTAVENERKSAKDNSEHRHDEYDRLARRMLGLHKQFGFDPLNCYDPDVVKKGYELMKSGLPQYFLDQLQAIENQAKALAMNVENSIKIVEGIPKKAESSTAEKGGAAGGELQIVSQEFVAIQPTPVPPRGVKVNLSAGEEL